MKFYVCEHCGNLITFVNESGVPVVCCGEKMKELVPGTTDAAVEKHVPVIQISGEEVLVKIGEVEHPMVKEHFIEWIALETEEGTQIKKLAPDEDPHAVFELTKTDKVIATYAYCNLHGLWKAEE